MLVARTIEELRGALRAGPASAADASTRDASIGGASSGVALVPTMGALHRGHGALLDAARRVAATVVASIFVNPTQFENAADLARYPRDEDADFAMLRDAGCDLVWAPSVAAMYPPGDATTIDVAGPALGWEGDARPGHFRGVATVVAKLFGQVRPDVAVFGEKDWQQLQVVRRMTSDLGLPVHVSGVATARAGDGLALSSRNRFLTAAERAIAPRLYQELGALAGRLQHGDASAAAVAETRLALHDAGFVVEYLALVDGNAMTPIEHASPGARLIAAAGLGTVRLLDNIAAVRG